MPSTCDCGVSAQKIVSCFYDAAAVKNFQDHVEKHIYAVAGKYMNPKLPLRNQLLKSLSALDTIVPHSNDYPHEEIEGGSEEFKTVMNFSLQSWHIKETRACPPLSIIPNWTYDGLRF
ncbi:hypothetical protein PoB_001463700 [Plakobranchus ocellatus]|uniref:Uncharacterized protein n=1 Tax=Plakobranchus ocellatus TaxID=259542 RepID=A0AAV3Z0W6_9GAST|nr:hypothetical protein PoB_001463700 [Plakobranchus ocellatus]